jgi:hypothetical protein
VSGQNSMLVRCQIDEISRQQNYKLVISQFDEMASKETANRQIGKLMIRQVYETLHL